MGHLEAKPPWHTAVTVSHFNEATETIVKRHSSASINGATDASVKREPPFVGTHQRRNRGNRPTANRQSSAVLLVSSVRFEAAGGVVDGFSESPSGVGSPLSNWFVHLISPSLSQVCQVPSGLPNQ
jgi:hypothetical protein